MILFYVKPLNPEAKILEPEQVAELQKRIAELDRDSNKAHYTVLTGGLREYRV